jgi:uroporphyrinogen-III synthase
MPFDGLRVLSLESRRAREMETLILRNGGKPFVAPSVKERPIEDPSVALAFIASLEANEFDMVICMTGVGLSFLCKTLEPHMAPNRIGAALRRAVVVSRGPKPVGVLRSLGVPVEIMIPEPNTWKEIVEAVAPRPERRIAVQEYGKPGLELIAALESLGARVTPVTLYRWELPDELEPLKTAAGNGCGVVYLIHPTRSSVGCRTLSQSGGRSEADAAGTRGSGLGRSRDDSDS